MSDALKPLIGAAADRPLTREEAEHAFAILFAGEATPSQIGGLLMALRTRGETVDEYAAAAAVMRSKCHHVHAPEGAIDIVGTGGDGKGTLNISTATAFVVAGAGVPVAKHGNRALSSKSGSADVLREIGINVDADMELVKQALWEADICFLMAPRHHSAMRHVGPTRVELGTRTIFNLLGPLSNPAGAEYQVLGVFAPEWVRPMAETLSSLGTKRAWVVHGMDGIDEISIAGTTKVCEVAGDDLHEFELTPADAGLETSPLSTLEGGGVADNAQAITDLLDGQEGPFRDVVLLNAAAGLHVYGKADSLKQGAAMAADAIDSGKAAQTLRALAALSNGQEPE